MACSLLYILMKACLVFVMSGCCWTWLLYYDGMSNQMGISSFSSGFVRSFVLLVCKIIACAKYLGHSDHLSISICSIYCIVLVMLDLELLLHSLLILLEQSLYCID